MPLGRPLNSRILTVILAFLEGLGRSSDVWSGDVWSVATTRGKLDTLTVRVEGGTRSPTGTNGGFFREDSGMLTGEVNLDVGEAAEAAELIFSVGLLEIPACCRGCHWIMAWGWLRCSLIDWWWPRPNLQCLSVSPLPGRPDPTTEFHDWRHSLQVTFTF